MCKSSVKELQLLISEYSFLETDSGCSPQTSGSTVHAKFFWQPSELAEKDDPTSPRSLSPDLQSCFTSTDMNIYLPRSYLKMTLLPHTVGMTLFPSWLHSIPSGSHLMLEWALWLNLGRWWDYVGKEWVPKRADGKQKLSSQAWISVLMISVGKTENSHQILWVRRSDDGAYPSGDMGATALWWTVLGMLMSFFPLGKLGNKVRKMGNFGNEYLRWDTYLGQKDILISEVGSLIWGWDDNEPNMGLHPHPFKPVAYWYAS